MARVFEIRVPGGATATTFIVEFEEQQYLFTANHVVESLGQHARVELQIDSKWLPFDVNILHGESKCNDVAVLIPLQKERITTADPLPYIEKFFAGQEIYFLGFPYGLAMQAPSIHITAPLVKHGYISAMVRCADLDPKFPVDEDVMVLDGFNNPGFSGGPVILRDLSDPKHPLKVVAIIKGFQGVNTPVSVNGRATSNVSVQTNTGIIVAAVFNRALDLIRNYKKSTPKP